MGLRTNWSRTSAVTCNWAPSIKRTSASFAAGVRRAGSRIKSAASVTETNKNESKTADAYLAQDMVQLLERGEFSRPCYLPDSLIAIDMPEIERPESGGKEQSRSPDWGCEFGCSATCAASSGRSSLLIHFPGRFPSNSFCSPC